MEELEKLRAENERLKAEVTTLRRELEKERTKFSHAHEIVKDYVRLVYESKG